LDMCSVSRAAIRVESKLVRMLDSTGEFEDFEVRHE